MAPGLLRPPHRAIGEGGLKQLRIIRQCDREAALLLFGEEIVKGGGERQAFLLLERDRDAVDVLRQRDQHLAMPHGDLGEVVGPC